MNSNQYVVIFDITQRFLINLKYSVKFVQLKAIKFDLPSKIMHYCSSGIFINISKNYLKYFYLYLTITKKAMISTLY